MDEEYDPRTPDPGGTPLELVVLHEGPHPPIDIVPGERWRDWMSATENRNANRCLPLLMANQSGWVLLNPAPFQVSWDGSDRAMGLRVKYASEVPEDQRIAKTNFGFGVLTFSFRCFFVTPRGYNLLCRGPANAPKDGIGPLEGLVETDWAPVPFSMNWKLTRRGTVKFDQGEPFCQLVPQRRYELERFHFRPRSLEMEVEDARRLNSWEAARAMVMLGKTTLRRSGDEQWRRMWLSDYFRGSSPTGERNEEHQTTLRLRSLD